MVTVWSSWTVEHPYDMVLRHWCWGHECSLQEDGGSQQGAWAKEPRTERAAATRRISGREGAALVKTNEKDWKWMKTKYLGTFGSVWCLWCVCAFPGFETRNRVIDLFWYLLGWTTTQMRSPLASIRLLGTKYHVLPRQSPFIKTGSWLRPAVGGCCRSWNSFGLKTLSFKRRLATWRRICIAGETNQKIDPNSVSSHGLFFSFIQRKQVSC